MKLVDLPIATLALAAGIGLACPGAAGESPGATWNSVVLAPAGAAPTSLSLGGRTLALSGGGFSLFDAAAKRKLDLGSGVMTGDTAFDASADNVRLHAEFMPRHDYILVRGEVENLGGGERGLIVDYRLPRLSPDAVFSNCLEQSEPMTGSAESEGNAFPIGAMAGGGSGVALAIPPTAPRDFGLVSDRSGLAIRFYLGLSPKPRRFPNRATFTFIIYSVDPKWGFRSALDRYYHFFPEYYTPLLKHEGLFMFQMAARIPANVDQYGFDLVENQFDDTIMGQAVARDQAHGITTFPYTIVGQREIKFLAALPKNYDEAMAALNHWTLASQAGHPITKENITNDRDAHLKAEIESSACQDSSGRYAITLRKTPWGDLSVTFKTNPSPDLFADLNRLTVASQQLAVDARWLKQFPEYGGIFVDSLGPRWPALFNYRQDHFVYARYPLTIDPTGRVAIQNTISHYEFLETLRAKLRETGRLIMGNGINAYKSQGIRKARKTLDTQKFNAVIDEFEGGGAPPEHYRPGTKLSRFFCCALLDAATSEFGVKASVENCLDNRTMLGRKPYAFINYAWTEPPKIAEFLNKTLCYGIYASTTTNYGTGEEYENNPHGYLRDKPLLDWYVPLVRMLAAAGWEPVRDAAVGGAGVSGERFGRGETVYFTLYNDSAAEQTGHLTVDLAALGFAPGNAQFVEVARNLPLEMAGGGNLTVKLGSKQACIIRLASKVRNGEGALALGGDR